MTRTTTKSLRMNNDQYRPDGSLKIYPNYYEEVRAAFDQLHVALFNYYKYAHVDLIGRATYQVKRELAELERWDSSGKPDLSEEQRLEDHQEGLSFHWRVVPAEDRVKELVLKVGFCEHFQQSPLELVVRIDEIPQWNNTSAKGFRKKPKRV